MVLGLITRKRRRIIMILQTVDKDSECFLVDIDHGFFLYECKGRKHLGFTAGNHAQNGVVVYTEDDIYISLPFECVVWPVRITSK